jgi:hypothetical protein
MVNILIFAMNYVLDDNMGDNANSNEKNARIVCELFAKRVKTHNHSGTHLNMIGYKNLMEKIK